jgi:hypothetical protein
MNFEKNLLGGDWCSEPAKKLAHLILASAIAYFYFVETKDNKSIRYIKSFIQRNFEFSEHILGWFWFAVKYIYGTDEIEKMSIMDLASSFFKQSYTTMAIASFSAYLIASLALTPLKSTAYFYMKLHSILCLGLTPTMYAANSLWNCTGRGCKRFGYLVPEPVDASILDVEVVSTGKKKSKEKKY